MITNKKEINKMSTKNLNKFLKNRLLTVSEASQMLDISNKKLIRFCQLGDIQYFKIGKQYRFTIETILNFKNK